MKGKIGNSNAERFFGECWVILRSHFGRERSEMRTLKGFGVYRHAER